MRVLVMRAADDAESTAEALGRIGHEAVIAPVIAVVPTAAAWPREPPDALVATSRHAFVSGCPPGLGPKMPVFAVGPRTAEAARQVGFTDLRIGARDGAALVPLVVLTLPRPGRLLHLAGRDRKEGLDAALEAAGYAVDVVEVYAAAPVEAWPETAVAALRAGTLDAALHFSRRSAELALSVARHHDAYDGLLRLRHLCLSADTAEPLLAADAAAVDVAERPDHDSLLALAASVTP